ncbi:MAG: glucan biosynthesis protein [Hyphomicrobium sp.]
MNDDEIDRRSIVSWAAGLAGVMAAAKVGLGLASAAAQSAAPPATGGAAQQNVPPAPPLFTADLVKDRARALSAAEYAKPKIDLPSPFDKLSYDQYRDIRFRTEKSIWRGEKIDFELQPFPMGWLYEAPVEMWLVDEGAATQMVADGNLFSIGPLIGTGPDAAPFGFSGFRIHGPINRADYFDEYVVFQGASYLRAVGRGQSYGASARGLALNTARPGGEEFPMFRAFWIEKPKPGASEIVVHALLDSPSTTGAYRFAIQPGEATVMDVEATLFPRKALGYVGIAPLTSMFLHGPADQRPMADFRPAVHDSQGLAMWSGAGERIWRPLTNPKMLQTSAFTDKDPKGFGLWQRDRSFASFQDLEAHYERRPSVWVEPKGSWGEGFIELIEIPVEDEIHDNIVVYWKPAAAYEPGLVQTLNYRLYWSEHVPAAWSGARVATTRVGRAKKPDEFLFVIDLQGTAVQDIRDLPVADITASKGAISNMVVQRNPELPGVRVAFELNPDGAELVELRLVLKAQEQTISETWLYRWTAP